MAQTKSLNSDNSVYVTTAYAGPFLGRTYRFVVNKDGKQTSALVTETELFNMIKDVPGSEVREDDGRRPVIHY